MGAYARRSYFLGLLAEMSPCAGECERMDTCQHRDRFARIDRDQEWRREDHAQIEVAAREVSQRWERRRASPRIGYR